jgi:gamma-glutamyltranspeptidase/glutathione hydrolase
MVATDSPLASQIGADVLKAGGNAFDAAVAASFALAVTRPESTGLGGGGFMLAYVAAQKRFIALDFREMAPASATAERYAKLHAERGEGPSPSIVGGNAVGVPGQVAGLFEINRRFGSQPLAELVRPAAAMAAVGFPIDAHYRDAVRDTLEEYDKHPQHKYWYAALRKTLLFDGKLPAVGTMLKRPDLAGALRMIADRGPEALYEGPIGEAIVATVNKDRGEMTAQDLRNYKVRELTPVRARVGEYEIVSMPPPSSGGVCLIETLNVLHCAAEDLGGLSKLAGDERYPPLLVKALRHSFADRARWLGDPDFASIPVDRLISADYGCELAKRLDAPLDECGMRELRDDSGTSHFCVADEQGNIVAMTETVNGTFGSYLVAEPYGIVLNNQMDDFATEPGGANLFGLVQGDRNVVAPGKRPLSSMSPTIVLRDGRPVLTLGGSGGPRIITAVLQVLINVTEFGMPLDEAMAAVRLHHQWRPDEVYFDREPPAELTAILEKAGLKMSDKRRGAAVQAIQWLPDGTLVGGSDPRKGGRPVGLP